MASKQNSGAVLEFIKALIVAIIITFLLVLLFAVIIKFCNIDSEYIPIINQCIKTLSVFIAVLMCFSSRPNGWLRGFIFGILYVAVSFVIFSAFNTAFIFDISLLNDCAFGGVSGLISGIIAVNVKKSK